MQRKKEKVCGTNFASLHALVFQPLVWAWEVGKPQNARWRHPVICNSSRYMIAVCRRGDMCFDISIFNNIFPAIYWYQKFVIPTELRKLCILNRITYTNRRYRSSYICIIRVIDAMITLIKLAIAFEKKSLLLTHAHNYIHMFLYITEEHPWSLK